MAYSIRLASEYKFFCAQKLLCVILDRLSKDGRFRVGQPSEPVASFKGLPKASKEPRFVIELGNIRLTKPKPYCGQHPGPCPTGAPRPMSKSLDWDDWVAFNNLLNDVLDAAALETEVWSAPREKLDQGSHFWIRKDNRRRVRWDWEEQDRGIGRPLLVWNHGSDDQFADAEDDRCFNGNHPHREGRCTVDGGTSPRATG